MAVQIPNHLLPVQEGQRHLRSGRDCGQHGQMTKSSAAPGRDSKKLHWLTLLILENKLNSSGETRQNQARSQVNRSCKLTTRLASQTDVSLYGDE